MVCPFPGMDPYLEHPDVWHSFHTRLVVQLANQITELLPDDYYVSVEDRAVIAIEGGDKTWSRPDLGVVDERPASEAISGSVATAIVGSLQVQVPVPEMIEERFLEIREGDESGRLVTSVEVLSPSNKLSGDDRGDYIVKRSEVLGHRTSLVEIDLLRAGDPMPLASPVARKDYSVLVARGWERPDAVLIPFAVSDPAPDFPVPLSKGDADLSIALGDAIHRVYELGRYWKRITYSLPPTPRLKADTAGWAEALLAEKGLR